MPFKKVSVKQMIEEEKISDPKFAKIWDENASQRDVLRQLVKYRKQSGLSQGELAVKAGMKQQMLSKIEQRTISPTLKTFCSILDAMGYQIVITKKDESTVASQVTNIIEKT